MTITEPAWSAALLEFESDHLRNNGVPDAPKRGYHVQLLLNQQSSELARLREASEQALEVLRRSLRASSAPPPTNEHIHSAFVALHNALSQPQPNPETE